MNGGGISHRALHLNTSGGPTRPNGKGCGAGGVLRQLGVLALLLANELTVFKCQSQSRLGLTWAFGIGGRTNWSRGRTQAFKSGRPLQLGCLEQLLGTDVAAVVAIAGAAGNALGIAAWICGKASPAASGMIEYCSVCLPLTGTSTRGFHKDMTSRVHMNR